ncbi:MAG: hypothetical protein JWR08_2631 [Enterovirga sp.]|jgi:SAM-dependent methyltransferase|nr:hypothetical protein [Enterovirga sp.]
MRTLSTPLPDPELIYLVNGHRDPDLFAASRLAVVDDIISLLETAGVDHTRFRSILDFGCGCGRALAGWEGRLPPGATLTGCDINPRLASFCQENIPFAKTVLTKFEPPLPFPDGAFDFVYVASVYTHLTKSDFRRWADEHARIIAPGGILMASFHGAAYEHLLPPDAVETLRRGGLFYYVHGEASDTFLGSNDYSTFSTPGFARKVFRNFDLLHLHLGRRTRPRTFAAHHDIGIFRRKQTLLERLLPAGSASRRT